MSDSTATPAGLMADPAPTKLRERHFDPLAVAAGGFFLLAVGFATVPVLAKASSEALASGLLLAGLAGVAVLGLLAFRSGNRPIVLEDEGAETFIEALGEAAAVAGPDGRVHAANAPWRAALGRAQASAPQRPRRAGPVRGARQGPQGRDRPGLGQGRRDEWPVSVAPLGAGRFLLRLDATARRPFA